MLLWRVRARAGTVKFSPQMVQVPVQVLVATGFSFEVKVLFCGYKKLTLISLNCESLSAGVTYSISFLRRVFGFDLLFIGVLECVSMGLMDRGSEDQNIGIVAEVTKMVEEKREVLFAGVRKDENEPGNSDQKYRKGSEGWKCKREDLLAYFKARRGVGGVKGKLASPGYDLEADQDEMRFGVAVEAMERGEDTHDMVKQKYIELYDEEARKAHEADQRCARDMKDSQAFDDWLRFQERRIKLKELGESLFGKDWVEKNLK
jgi:hypothetical protein